MNLPVGMKYVSFERCEGITGTADLGRSEVHIYLIRFGGQPQYVLLTLLFRSSFFITLSPLPSLPQLPPVARVVAHMTSTTARTTSTVCGAGFH